ncbi:MAG: UDP-3-O-(3-hydroxymyristoyl)glucosamine N-acyltransferase [Betaproteobacteria bacterium]|nr:MAG: UDP-3-O-(3-hydroxymyristoyl)glucosamine N-acyltransferase [Betaproteobacteria bacterium]
MTEPLSKDYALTDLTALFGGEVIGDASIRISRIASLDSAQTGDLTFITSARYQAELEKTRASAVILSPQLVDATAAARIVCDNPYAYYARVCALLNPPHRYPVGVHERAQVSTTARIADSVSVGPGAMIDDDADIGADVRIGAGCYVGRGVRIGAGTLLHANVTIYDRCVIGERGIVHSGAVIGADGFGMAMDQGQWLKIPQIGRVVIGADVEVGANTTIDRGALDDTVIEDDVKLDNQVQIGHNCHIGEHTAIAGCVGIAGSARIGRYCRIGGAAMIHGHIEIADNVEVSGGTLVPNSINKAGKYTAVFPMSEHRDWIINASLTRRLRDLRDRIRALESRRADEDK